ncbi:MAG: hypothetical protein A3F84_29705 [Candidatus Handelsmanbacteria bacterium RIFCSPLOWO2_12_FULL_64_10]|uniref:Polysaccharide deacetylase n=1 Tax=Handelsmanbacteria sp. (strain RIFCSPLOWO2_12_FULL_64_10) TaxID=1817868 RepID=A0A1F6D248_HANXR|nr:MAG: hypothetical protein A3F84_29705 [Candidatus Handelsmanbacteria bacterium RIFCSPLOWO2_12_FULL_64_10]
MASRTRISFFLDDVAPYVTGVPGREGEVCPVDAAALVEVLDFLRARGLSGAISVIPGIRGLLTRPRDAHERRFAEGVGRLRDYPVDTHMEIMTHGRLFDFSRMAPAEGDMTEMAWLDDPAVSVEACRDYFLGTIRVGRNLGISYTGLTTPGTHSHMNPNVWTALLELAEAGEFPNRAVPVFATVEEGTIPATPRPRAVRGRFGVYDLPSGVWDYMASWRNAQDWVNVDHYVDAKGGGHLAALIQAGSPVAVFHVHWQGLNPQTGLGWEAFEKMIDRLTAQFGDRIVWQRPSEIAAAFHQTQGG